MCQAIYVVHKKYFSETPRSRAEEYVCTKVESYELHVVVDEERCVAQFMAPRKAYHKLTQAAPAVATGSAILVT